MANWFEPTAVQRAEWAQFVTTRPGDLRLIAAMFEPWKLYRLKSSGHRVTLYSFGEHTDGSVSLTVIVSGKFNLVAFERRVFGIEPDDLEECELPVHDELLGSAGLSVEQAVAEMTKQGAAN